MDGTIVIGTEIDTKGFDNQIKYIESKMLDIEDKLKQADMGFEVGDTQKLEAEYEKLGNQLLGLKEKQEKYNQSIRETQIAGFGNIKSSIEGIGKSMQKVVKKVVRWGLAVFSIRSAYMLVRNAINTIAGDDEQLKADIDYMKSAIAYAIEPLVRNIVNLTKQLLYYIQYIVKAWTGKNIFENANKGLDSANKKAKALQKTTASFDEMNVLSDNSSSGGAAPSFDLTQMQGEVPAWIQWIADNKDIVIGALAGITAGLIALRVFGVEPLVATGIGLIVAGLVIAIQGIIDFINDPSWHNFLTILEGIALVVAGIALLMGGWVVALAALGAAIVAYVIQNWDKVKEILGKVGTWIYDHIIKPVGDFFKKLWDGISDGASKLWEGIKNGFKGFINLIINGINTLIKGINKIGFDVPDWVPLIGGKRWGFNIPEIPKLAKGGIVNMPGRGVPVGGALTGEVSREGVIPLTDSQQMALLGEAIGRYITINANITNTMNGRVISRELQKINNESDFAFNR